MNKFKEKIWNDKKRRALFLTLTSILLVLVILFTAGAIYLGTYYRADDEAIASFTVEAEVKEEKTKDGNWIFTPTETQPTAGFIFYPGGKVEHDAYKPLMRELASKGVLCVLIEMPFRLAIFDVNAADGIAEKYPEVTSWYIGGHSLGGSMAASYVSKNSDEFKGLVLLASYSTDNLQNSGLRVLSIYGDKDEVLNEKAYEKNLSNLPDDCEMYILKGGNHAYFGMYGEQSGDGKATLTNEEQIRQTAASIAQFILRGSIV
ncbi:MAG: alpha/beta hydrolase [Clostridia bacterium]|nr:alpha/beta hydrolase [Clostridia bacterium]